MALSFLVAPLAGAWIEIFNPNKVKEIKKVSLPSRERGLKFVFAVLNHQPNLRRSPRGSVD